MLTLRPEQLEILDAHMMRKFEDRVIAKLEEVFPDRFEPGNEMEARNFVRAGVRKGERYDITEDEDVEDLVLLLAKYGLNFEKDRKYLDCRLILEDKDLMGDAKVTLLEDELESPAESDDS